MLLLLRLSAALSAFNTLSPVRQSNSAVSINTTSMKVIGSNGGLLSSWRRSQTRPSVLALIGGIASGKSTVSKALGAECGLEVIDADKLGHESYRPGTRCFGRLVDAFGAKIVAGDGTIDRRALGEVVSWLSAAAQQLYCCTATDEYSTLHVCVPSNKDCALPAQHTLCYCYTACGLFVCRNIVGLVS